MQQTRLRFLAKANEVLSDVFQGHDVLEFVLKHAAHALLRHHLSHVVAPRSVEEQHTLEQPFGQNVFLDPARREGGNPERDARLCLNLAVLHVLGQRVAVTADGVHRLLQVEDDFGEELLGVGLEKD